jgi:hypothetical protein
VTLARISFKAAIVLTLFSILSVQALTQDGSVPGTPPKPAAATPVDSPATNDSKPLPWKFLAKPMGVLDPNDDDKWSTFLKSFDCNDAPKCSMPDPGRLNKLFASTIGTLPKSQTVYVVLHVIQHPDPGPSGQDTTKIISDHWYLYRSLKHSYGDPKWTYEKFTGQRIYGASSVYFLFLHVNADVITLQNARLQVQHLIQLAKGKVNYLGTHEEMKSAQDKDNIIKADFDTAKTDELKQVPDAVSDDQINNAIRSNNLAITLKDKSVPELKFCDATSGDQFDWSTQSGISFKYKRIRYEAAVVKRTPANVENLKTILGLLLGGTQAKELTCLKITANDILWGAGRVDNITPPSDISIAGFAVVHDDDVDKPVQDADRSKLQIGTTGSYNDEQLYWWDASIGIPVHKIKDLQYSNTDNTVTATQVDKQSAYAMFNLMLHPVDLSSPGDNVWPRILVGFPLASSPWDKLFAGGAIGLPWKPFQNFQFFAGATFMRTTTPATLAAGQAATNAQLQNDLRIKMISKLTVGINVPVKSVIDKLKK